MLSRSRPDMSGIVSPVSKPSLPELETSSNTTSFFSDFFSEAESTDASSMSRHENCGPPSLVWVVAVSLKASFPADRNPVIPPDPTGAATVVAGFSVACPNWHCDRYPVKKRLVLLRIFSARPHARRPEPHPPRVERRIQDLDILQKHIKPEITSNVGSTRPVFIQFVSANKQVSILAY